MTGIPPNFALSQVAIDGLDGDARATAEMEVKSLFQLACLADAGSRQPVDISVQLTADLAGAIDRFNAEHGIAAPPYNRTRPQGTSCGKVLAVPGDGGAFSYIIILDAALWSEPSPEHVVYRAYGLARLLSHIVNKHRADQATPTPPTFSSQYATSLWQRSSALCDAWDEHVMAVSMCNACLRDQDGNSVSLTHHLGGQSLQMVSEFLDQLCIFACFDVQLYRATALGLDDLPPTAVTLSEGLLASVVEAVSLFAACNQFDHLHGVVSRMNGFGEFLEPIWTNIIDGCTAEEGHTRRQAFTDAFTLLFDRLGLRIEDMEGGDLYVHVHEPVRCSWTEGDEASA